ncbi:putative transcription initiation factor TFIIF subunit beta [Paratrimastix pyriformis]|uniref:Transcription initiation factor TFIIF subunit beta n=1 Tax=Paratrimastix pyriformis TaxID=342808 RepID=A0ABQ8UE14_9EUKA|nr:putative transcription initiation factor TFIIF subunit beta [Paratrimastix pyriformis]
MTVEVRKRSFEYEHVWRCPSNIPSFDAEFIINDVVLLSPAAVVPLISPRLDELFLPNGYFPPMKTDGPRAFPPGPQQGGQPAPADSEPMGVDHVDRKVWLLKIPRAVADSWRKNGETPVLVGKMHIETSPGSSLVRLDPNPALAATQRIPSIDMDHTTSPASMVWFSTVPEIHVPPPPPRPHRSGFRKRKEQPEAPPPEPQLPPQCISLEGVVGSRFVPKPTALAVDYIERAVNQRLEPQIQMAGDVRPDSVIKITTVTTGPAAAGTKRRPSSPVHRKGKEEKLKRARTMTKEGLEEVITQLFSQQPYWQPKQIMDRTDQPHSFVVEVLRNLCIPVKKGPQKGSWELRPEYRAPSAPAPATATKQHGVDGLPAKMNRSEFSHVPSPPQPGKRALQAAQTRLGDLSSSVYLMTRKCPQPQTQPHLVALKRICCADFEEANQLLRAGFALVSLQHPGFPQCFSVFLDPPDPDGSLVVCVVMEACRGPSLAEMLHQPCEEPSLTQDERETIAESLLETLTFLESKGIIHKDVKPSNVLFRVRAHPILVGLLSSPHLYEDYPLGQADFLAPEVALHPPRPTPRTPLFSAALTIVATLAGIELPQGLRATLGAGSARPYAWELCQGGQAEALYARVRACLQASGLCPRRIDLLVAMLATNAEERPTAAQALERWRVQANTADPTQETAVLAPPPTSPSPPIATPPPPLPVVAPGPAGADLPPTPAADSPATSDIHTPPSNVPSSTEVPIAPPPAPQVGSAPPPSEGAPTAIASAKERKKKRRKDKRAKKEKGMGNELEKGVPPEPDPNQLLAMALELFQGPEPLSTPADVRQCIRMNATVLTALLRRPDGPSYPYIFNMIERHVRLAGSLPEFLDMGNAPVLVRLLSDRQHGIEAARVIGIILVQDEQLATPFIAAGIVDALRNIADKPEMPLLAALLPASSLPGLAETLVELLHQTPVISANSEFVCHLYDAILRGLSDPDVAAAFIQVGMIRPLMAHLVATATLQPVPISLTKLLACFATLAKVQDPWTNATLAEAGIAKPLVEMLRTMPHKSSGWSEKDQILLARLLIRHCDWEMPSIARPSHEAGLSAAIRQCILDLDPRATSNILFVGVLFGLLEGVWHSGVTKEAAFFESGLLQREIAILRGIAARDDANLIWQNAPTMCGYGGYLRAAVTGSPAAAKELLDLGIIENCLDPLLRLPPTHDVVTHYLILTISALCDHIAQTPSSGPLTRMRTGQLPESVAACTAKSGFATAPLDACAALAKDPECAERMARSLGPRAVSALRTDSASADRIMQALRAFMPHPDAMAHFHDLGQCLVQAFREYVSQVGPLRPSGTVTTSILEVLVHSGKAVIRTMVNEGLSDLLTRVLAEPAYSSAPADTGGEPGSEPFGECALMACALCVIPEFREPFVPLAGRVVALIRQALSQKLKTTAFTLTALLHGILACDGETIDCGRAGEVMAAGVAPLLIQVSHEMRTRGDTEGMKAATRIMEALTQTGNPEATGAFRDTLTKQSTVLPG